MELPELRPGGWALLMMPHGGTPELLVAAARLAERGPVTILDGGNRCNAYTLARAARGRADVLMRIHISRAFTCYQMAALLEETPGGSSPIILLDMLATFYDENVPAIERRRLLNGCLGEIRRLGGRAIVVVSAGRAKVPSPESDRLLEMLQAAAGQVWQSEPPLPAPEPQRLF